MKLPLLNNNDQTYAKEKLEKYYKNKLIPAEKKTYLSQLESSIGAYMGIDSGTDTPHFMMDAASQIATLGLGFNPSVFMGTSHFLESWLNTSHTDNFKKVHSAFQAFLKRKLEWDQIHTFYCNSGAEANEIALSFCYQQRKNKRAKKVLAFEGSFHGRMLVSLASTWNKSKREPFEMPGVETLFSPYPAMNHAKIEQLAPRDWTLTWEMAPLTNFEIPAHLLASAKADELLQLEIDCLLDVREKLVSGDIFALIVEPMQCEGGDRYSSDRFNNALVAMAQSFNIPVIYDEVQTGFHLGADFFWHKLFNLNSSGNTPLYPDYIICAKKAQTGLVIGKNPFPPQLEHTEDFQVASVIRGYLHAMALDQTQGKIHELQVIAEEKLETLIQNFAEHLENPRALGLAFAFDLKDGTKINDVIAKRFDQGLLYYPAGDKTLRFRLNTSFSNSDMDFLFTQLHSIFDHIFNNKELAPPEAIDKNAPSIKQLYKWHELLLHNKLHSLLANEDKFETVFKKIKSFMHDSFDLELVLFTAKNFAKYQSKIIAIQEKMYEPSRQTPIEKFERAVKDPSGLCIAIIDEKTQELAGMAFAASIKLFPLERGVRNDPRFYDQSNTLYMLDTTIDKNHQGVGLGKNIKYALALLAQTRGYEFIQGRNRDKLASGMLCINLSLGSYEQRYYQEDYPDFEEHRDVIYYSSSLKWQAPQLNLSQGINSHLSPNDLNESFIKQQFPYMTNKICLSNFVSERFLEQIKDIFDLLPSNLRHGFTASGQSECVDKVIKSLWVTHPDLKNQSKIRHISFKGHYFGAGSFAARSLSSEFYEIGQDYFPVTFLDHPNAKNIGSVLTELENELKKGDVFGIWMEPLPQRLLEYCEQDHLKKIKELAGRYKTPLIYNETAAAKWRFDENHFFASNISEITPDLGFCFLGGQAGLVFMQEEYFLDKPLMMISTWDGDEVAFAHFHRAYADKKRNKDHQKNLTTLINEFEAKLSKTLASYSGIELTLKRGIGRIKGNLPSHLRCLFAEVKDHYQVYPSEGAMKEFIAKDIGHDTGK